MSTTKRRSSSSSRKSKKVDIPSIEYETDSDCSAVPTNAQPKPKLSPKKEKTLVEEEEVAVPRPEPISPNKVIVRTVSACVMTLLYLLMLQAGHFYCILVGIISQIELFRELVNVRYVEAKLRSMPLFRTLQWSWFTLAMIYVYGGKIKKFCIQPYAFIFQHQNHFACQLLSANIAQYIDYIVFVGYCIVFMATVLTFKKHLIRFQISQIFWTIATTTIVVAVCAVFVSNTMQGLFWFFFPMATVVMNDVSAYFCGITMGRKFIKAPFLSISPNKTWEGFIGAGILTLIFSFFFPLLLSQWTWFTCPLEGGLVLSPFPPPLNCDLNPVFLPATYKLPLVLGGYSFQLHGMVYGIFASFVSPFGGFFASAIKRAYNKKDFDSFMPGHGGLMDRMDCQIVMISFCYVHYRTFIHRIIPSVTDLFSVALLMNRADQEALLHKLTDYLKSQSL